MRPKLLEIEGLQSYTDIQRIDFEALGETGLFGIFGPTGSGKSTILDAITFALYGRIKRAENGTQGIIHSKLNTAKVSYTFELAKDGERKTYRIERTYQRKKNSPNACVPKVARIIEITDEGEIPLCDKAMEVSYFVRDLLGLGNEDFTRAVVLPQNSFQEFLLLNNKDRRGMLERIFYLEEYGKQLIDKLGRKMAKLKSRVDMLSGELMGYADASDEALEEAYNAMKNALEERNRVEKELKLQETQFHEAKEVWDLVTELKEFVRKEEQHAASKDNIAVKRQQLEKAVKADGMLEMIRKCRNIREKLKDTDRQLEKIGAALPGVVTGLNEIKAKYDEVKKEAVMEQPKLVEQRIRLVDALNVQKELVGISKQFTGLQTSVTQLNMAMAQKDEIIKKESLELELSEKSIEKLGEEIELYKTDPDYRLHIQEGTALEKEVAALSGSTKEHEDKKAALLNSAVELKQRMDIVHMDIASNTKEQERLTAEKLKHEEGKPGEKNAVQKSIDRIHMVQGVYDVLILRQNELDQLKKKLEIQQANLGKMVRSAAELEKLKAGADEKYHNCRIELETTMEEMNRNSAYILSKNLKEGEPCPVCGSMQHPSPVVHMEVVELSELEQKLETAQKKLAAAEKDSKKAEREVVVAVEQIRTLTEQNAILIQELERKTGDFEKEKQRLPEKLRFSDLDQVRQEIENANATYTQKLKAVETWEIEQEAYRESLRKLQDIMTGHKLIENGLATESKLSQESLEQLEKAEAAAKKQLEQQQLRYTAFLQQYEIENADAELKRIAENDRKLHLLQKEMEQARETAGNQRMRLDRLKEELRMLSDDYIKRKADAAAMFRQKSDMETRLNELAGELSIEDEIRRIDEKLDGYGRLEKEYQQRIEMLDKQHGELLTQKSLLGNQQRIYTETLENDEMQLMSALMEKGFTDDNEVENSLLEPDVQKALKIQIDEYDQIVINFRAQKGMLEKKLKGRTITEEEWNRTDQAYAELKAYYEACVSRSEVTKNNYQGLTKKHERWVELGRSFQEVNHKLGLFEQINRILKAQHGKDNSFIDYIAQERLRYVAAKASETLGVMTKYRYTLELDTETGFIIRDNANGGVHRMVTSLSGGETFLTSLSLALALSEQIQLKGQSPLEFFFLDEGFGTLDHDLLDTVIDALERLSSRERVIGLISHVPELKSRIGRRLVVIPPNMQGDGSKIVIEKA